MWPISKIKAVFASIDAQLKEKTAQIESLQAQIQVLQAQSESLQAQSETMQAHISTLQEQDTVSQNQITALQAEASALQEEITQANSESARLAELQNRIAFDFEEHRHDKNNDHWTTRFGYDSLLANLQLAAVEQVAPGNRARLEALKDTHKGEKCFVIGNGPSLKAADLDKLKEKGIFCFGSKRINAIFDETDWRPDIWGVSDLGFISIYHDEMSELQGFPKLVPCQSIINLNIPIKDAIYFPFIQTERTPCWFNKDVTRGVHFWGTITCKLINFAVYMGFTEIYLLGVGHSYPVTTDANNKKVLDLTKQTYFSENYYDSKSDLACATQDVNDMESALQYVTQAYKDVKYFCDTFNVKVYNATRGGELQVYPRIDFSEVFNA